MNTDKKGLGATPAPGRQDVSFILQGGAPSSAFEIQQIPVSLIDESDALRLRQAPYPEIDKLAEELQRFGQTTPLFVRPKGDRFELISGYRRLAALNKLQAPTALCRIYRTLDDSRAYDLAISENQDRESLTDIERADICLRLQKDGRTAEEIALRMGWNGERQVFRHLKLAREASPALRLRLQARQVNASVAFALLEEGLGELGDNVQSELLRTVVENEMSVRDARACLARTKSAQNPRPDSSPKNSETIFLQEYKNGSFAITAKIDPKKPEHLDKAIASLETALKRARLLKRKLEKQSQTAGASGNDFDASSGEVSADDGVH